jgi:beta-aspartyl-peptidase (threonine type)
MKDIAIVVHGGAGPDSDYIRTHLPEHELGIGEAVDAGYEILEKGGTAVEAIAAAVRALEDNPYFNAGRGSALNAEGKVEMCTSMMEGKDLQSGAAAIVTNVRNPIMLAKALLEDATCLYLGDRHALERAKELGLDIEPDAYFITERQFDVFEEKRRHHPHERKSSIFRKYERKNLGEQEQREQKYHGTVGAVAVDKNGNVAAGTSTGGTEYCIPGRIGDSSMIGVGSYADNRTAAISATGDGEYLIREVMCHSISAIIEHTGCTVQEACTNIIHVRNKDTDGDLGVICVDARGNIGIAFNSERMHRGWKTPKEKRVMIYK